MSQNVVIKAAGLHSNNNPYSAAPNGSMSEAVNVVIDKTEVVEPRRGFYQYSNNLTQYAKQLINYKDRILVNTDAGQLHYDADGVGSFYQFGGVGCVPADDNIKIKSVEANGNLYYTTQSGIARLSARDANDFGNISAELAGMAKAVNLYGNTDYSQVGFLDPNSKVSYRVLFTREDLNENLLIGSPSPILTVYNVSLTQSCIVDLNFTLPSDVAVGDTYQIYRTALSTEAATIPIVEPADPGDEMYLVIEDVITQDDVTNGSIGVTLSYASLIEQDLTYTAIEEGVNGNDITIEYTAGALAGAEVVTVVGNAISVQIEDGVSTATQIKTAVDALPAAAALVSVAVTGIGAATQTINGPTNLAGGTGYILQDITPDDFRRSGTLLYTNPVSGEGITQANEKPPFAKDICVYKGFTWFANTRTAHRLTLNFISIEALVSGVSTFTVANGLASTVYTFQGTNETHTITYVGAAANNFVNAAPATAKYFTLVSANDERKYYVWFNDGTQTLGVDNNTDPALSGYIGIEVTVLTADSPDTKMQKALTAINDATDDFNLSLDTTADTLTAACSNNGDVSIALTDNITNLSTSSNGLGTGEDVANKKIFLPKVPATGQNGPSTAQQLEQAAKSLAKVITSEDTYVNVFYMSSYNDVPGQLMFETKLTTGYQFWVNSNAAASTFNPTLDNVTATVISSNEVRPNRIYYSKYQQPDAVPLVNYLDVGAKDREIKRIMPLRDSLFILKEDGIYKLTGDTATGGTNNFTVAEFDFSVQILAPDTAVVLNNQIYALATQGVVSISDTVVTIISRPIENQILQIVKSGTNYKTLSFGIPYESDRSYLLSTVSNSNDEVCTQIFRYNTFTNTWTKWLMSKECGIVNFADDKLYLGATDLTLVERERKQLSRLDYADREYSVSIPANGLDSVNNLIKISSLTNADVGNVFLQRQYLTISQFNRLLKKLDADIGVADSNYFATLEAVAGDNMRAKIVALAAKLDADGGVTDTDYASSIGSYTYAITNIAVANPVQITVGAHSILEGRYVNISGSDSWLPIDGNWEISGVGANDVYISYAYVAFSGATGTVQTADNSFKDIQACFNIIVDKLNADAGVQYSDYQTSTGYHDFECIIEGKLPLTTQIEVANVLDFILGEAFIFQKIESKVTYNPQFFGDPSIEKQVSEGTIMFEDSNFTTASIAYASDRSPAFESIEFDKAGIGSFGQFSFGGGQNMNFGGVSAPIPLRTYIPLAKQRCRFINVRFSHSIALQDYAIYGISLKFRPYNTRVAK